MIAMTIRFNGSDNPTGVDFIQNGKTNYIQKVVFSHNGTSTTVWEGHPSRIDEIKFALSGDSSLVIRNCRFQDSSSVILNGVVVQIARYLGSLSSSLKSTKGTSFGIPSDDYWNYVWTGKSSGVPSGYSFYACNVPASSKTVYVDKKGLPSFDEKNLSRESRNLSLYLGSDASSVAMSIEPKSGDKVYYSTGGTLSFSGQVYVSVMKG